ncbi:MAG: hypothetical protein ACXVLQ_12295 [Bacteriovorax sp.]
MENKCCHESCEFEPHHHHHHCHDESCGLEDHFLHLEGQSKEEENVEKWVCAFHEAMREAKVEILKAKILKAWSSKLDKSADAVFETMEIKWRAKLTKEKAKMDLKDRLTKLMMETKP